MANPTIGKGVYHNYAGRREYSGIVVFPERAMGRIVYIAHPMAGAQIENTIYAQDNNSEQGAIDKLYELLGDEPQ
jgi:hypothetical protein